MVIISTKNSVAYVNEEQFSCIVFRGNKVMIYGDDKENPKRTFDKVDSVRYIRDGKEYYETSQKLEDTKRELAILEKKYWNVHDCLRRLYFKIRGWDDEAKAKEVEDEIESAFREFNSYKAEESKK